MRGMPKKVAAGLLGFLSLILMASSPVQALPAVQGDIKLQVAQIEGNPFGGNINVGDTFTAIFACDGSVFPQDGTARGRVTKFFLQIGDTSWDETMTPAGTPLIFELLFVDGSVRGLQGAITPYNPAHPDLFFEFPASPGQWRAIDQVTLPNARNGAGEVQDRGGVYGFYTPNLTVVPLPGALGLFGLGLVLLAGRRLTAI